MAERHRLDWLDALRGFAALVVCYFHAVPYLFGPALPNAIKPYVDLGKYGVLLFFLVSGYVIPMSLERHGSLRTFWVGRVFRIYPAFLFSLAVMGALVAFGPLVWTQTLHTETAAGVLGHATMMQEFLGLRGGLVVYWTLAYELTFYLMVAGLFVYGLHRRSTWWASGLALAALLAGPVLPDDLFSPGPHGRRALAAVLVLVVAVVLAAFLSGRRRPTLVAGAVGIGFVLLPALNGSPADGGVVTSSWQGLLMLAAMFAGTVVFQAERGDIRWSVAGLALGTVLVCMVLAHAVHGPESFIDALGGVWFWTPVSVAVTFAAVFALRRRRFPRLLAWTGAISYSVYLLHVIVIDVMRRTIGMVGARPLAERVTFAVAFAAVVLLAAWLSYTYVEQPAQRWGRRVLRAMDRRWPVPGRRITVRSAPARHAEPAGAAPLTGLHDTPVPQQNVADRTPSL